MTQRMEERRTRGGYSFNTGRGWYLVRCHDCGRENWMLSVISGICCWCGYNDNERKEEADGRGVSSGSHHDG